jgi:hypothetical protein
MSFIGSTPQSAIEPKAQGSNDLEYTFQRALHEMYKFQVLRRQRA